MAVGAGCVLTIVALAIWLNGPPRGEFQPVEGASDAGTPEGTPGGTQSEALIDTSTSEEAKEEEASTPSSVVSAPGRPDGSESTPDHTEEDEGLPEVPRSLPANLLVMGSPEPKQVWLGTLDVAGFSSELRVETNGDGIANVWGIEAGTGVLDLGTKKMTFDVVSEAPPIEDAEAAPVPDGGMMNLFVGDEIPFPVPGGAGTGSYGCSEGWEFLQLGPAQHAGETVILLRATAPGRAVCRISGVDVVLMIRAE